jgi:uncharacterized protein YndB with AHSA1/START domain
MRYQSAAQLDRELRTSKDIRQALEQMLIELQTVALVRQRLNGSREDWLRITIEREFDAPRELVWKAWTDPDEVEKWWGPEGFTTPRESIEYDLRPGGTAKLTMVAPDGTEYPNSGNFGIVEPPERLSWVEDEVDSDMMESVETTMEFVALDDDRTKVVITSRMVCAEELVSMANAGWNSQLDKLERLLAS